MNNKNVILNYTLEKYNKKYRNRRYRLIKYTKKEVEDFDKQYGHYIFNKKTYSLEFNNYLLKDRKWVLINGTYYEIPKPIRFTWFRNLNAAVQAITCLVGVGAVSSAIAVPTLMFTVWNKGGDTPTPTPEPLKPVDFKTCSWNDVAIRCTKLENGEITENEFCNLFTFDGANGSSLSDFIGKEKTVKLINLDGTEQTNPHRVRIIGTNHDIDNNNKKLALTFEFANLISDKDGNSLAYLWDDKSVLAGCNNNYIHSSIRKALCGTGDFATDVLCAQKGQTTWSNDYKNKYILSSMFPNDLKSALKTTKKTVGIGTDYTESEYSDKLFMLSLKEMGYTDPIEYDRGFGTTYSYYSGHTDLTDEIRIKKQVNGSEMYTTEPYINSGHQYTTRAKHSAGYNYRADNHGGGKYWLRSPQYAPIASNPSKAWNCNGSGLVDSDNAVITKAYAVAPAFCL